MISIITPVYNAEKTLDKCIKSIIGQSYKDWELLLIDDGSIDDSLNICNKYAHSDSRIRVFHQANNGASSARNVGLDNARGEWIAFCDADDWVDENWLSLFTSNACDSIQMIVQGFTAHNGTWHGENTGIDFIGNAKTGILLLAQNKILGYLWPKLFNRNVINAHALRFNQQFSFREDEDFILRYLRYAPQMLCVSSSAYNYVLPDFSKKYQAADNFYPFLSIFSTLKEIYNDTTDNWLLDDYAKELTQSLFFSFQNKTKDRKQKLRLYRKEVGRCVLNVANLSVFTKYILVFVPSTFLIYSIFKAKEAVANRLKK